MLLRCLTCSTLISLTTRYADIQLRHYFISKFTHTKVSTLLRTGLDTCRRLEHFAFSNNPITITLAELDVFPLGRGFLFCDLLRFFLCSWPMCSVFGSETISAHKHRHLTSLLYLEAQNVRSRVKPLDDHLIWACRNSSGTESMDFFFISFMNSALFHIKYIHPSNYS